MVRRGPAGPRGGRPGVHHQRRAAAAVPGGHGAPAGPGRRGHGRGPAGRTGQRGLVRRGGPRVAGGRRRGRAGRSAGGAGGGHGGGRRRRAARHHRRHGQGHPVRRVPGQGPGHRRGALPPLPQGRGPAGAGLGRAGPGPGRDRGRVAGGAAARRRAAGTARASGSASRSRRWAERPDERGPADHHRDQHRAPALAARPAGRHRGSVVPARRPAGPGRRPPPDVHHRHRDGRQPGAAGRVLQRVQPAGHAGLAPVAVPDAVREPTSGST